MVKQKKRSRPLEITPVAISKVPCTHIQAFTQEQNQFIQEKHKEVLSRAMNLNKKHKSNSMEVVILLHTHTWEDWVIEGTTERVVLLKNNPIANQILDTSPKNSLILLHNHPSTGTFSAVDIKTFCNIDSLYIITVVGNDGTVYILKKEKDFQPARLLLEYGILAKKYSNYNNNATKAVAHILKDACKYGLSYKKGRSKI